MKVFAILTLAMCFCMVLGNKETLLKAASGIAKRSVAPRQNCDITILQNYPSDCLQAYQTLDPTSQSIMIPAILCEARCFQPAINFYISCNLDFVVQSFEVLCGTNAMGQRCGSDSVQMALNTTGTSIGTNCAANIVGTNTNCTTQCQDALTSARMSLGCCLNVLNITATVGIANPIYNHQFWEQSCGVDLPLPCSGGVALVISKVALAVTLLLLGTLVF